MKQKTFYFFSYGSNLLLKRIKNRCSSVEVVERKKLTGYKLSFNKLSKDGSGKANIVETNNDSDFVMGIVHRINWHDKPIFDRAEGLIQGYELKTVFYYPPITRSYISTEEKYLTNKKPYKWYLRLVIEGAKENNFPEEYIDYLKSIETKADEDECRRLKQLSAIDTKYAQRHYEKCK